MENNVICLNCGLQKSREIYIDELGQYSYCEECKHSFDVDL